MGLYYAITDELETPFETDVLGVKVTVESVELNDGDESWRSAATAHTASALRSST